MCGERGAARSEAAGIGRALLGRRRQVVKVASRWSCYRLFLA